MRRITMKEKGGKDLDVGFDGEYMYVVSPSSMLAMIRGVQFFRDKF